MVMPVHQVWKMGLVKTMTDPCPLRTAWDDRPIGWTDVMGCPALGMECDSARHHNCRLRHYLNEDGKKVIEGAQSYEG